MTLPISTITQDEYDALKITLAARDKEIERLRAELAFYADPENWKSPSRGFVLQYDPELSPVHKVRHARAAAALQPKEGV